MNCSMPGLPVHHQLLEFTQTHVHRVSDAIQPSPLSFPSPAPNPSQYHGLFRWVNSSHEVAKVLDFQLQHQSFQWTPTQDWSLLGWSGWISLQSKGLSRVFSNTTVQKHQFFGAQLSYSPTLTFIHDHWKNHSLWNFVGKVMSLLLSMLSVLVIPFLPRIKHFSISLLQSQSTVILEPNKIKSDTVSTCYPIYFPWSDGTNTMILVFWMLSFKPTFSLSSFTFIKRLFSSSSLSAVRVVSSAYLRLLIFLPAKLVAFYFLKSLFCSYLLLVL